MKAIILCAGYGTRLSPLTDNMPKALLEVQGKSMLNLLLENLEQIEQIDEIVIVSNDRFFKHFNDYRPLMATSKKVTILNDGTTCNENRLGAIGDINFALNVIGYRDECMVLCTDNWFDFSLKDFYKFYTSHGKGSVVFGKKTEDMRVLKAGGVALLEGDKVYQMEEKPQTPKGNFAVGPFYIFNQEATSLIEHYLATGGNPDAPGHYPSYLANHGYNVYAMDISTKHCIDIGTKEVYYGIENTIKNIKKANTLGE